ncbi:hypothetical protein Adt_02777 [Abeliophyllum distichum]|uniref:Uncharacterized protein n=1 Tax=Abeliophyllum distichum TaxID=126358 RepID=A0ABD1VWL5_9LAMI
MSKIGEPSKSRDDHLGSSVVPTTIACQTIVHFTSLLAYVSTTNVSHGLHNEDGRLAGVSSEPGSKLESLDTHEIGLESVFGDEVAESLASTWEISGEYEMD